MTEEIDIGNLVYHGNSVGYIYQKMRCYGDQVITMADMLRIIGCDYSLMGDDNQERHENGLREAKKFKDKILLSALKSEEVTKMRQKLLWVARFFSESPGNENEVMEKFAMEPIEDYDRLVERLETDLNKKEG